MNLTAMKFQKNQIEAKLYNLHSEIAVAEVNNSRFDDMRTKLLKLADLQTDIAEYLADLYSINAAAREAEHNYQNRRIQYLNVLITDALKEIFPKEDLRVEIIYDFHRKDTIRLKLVDRFGNESNPMIAQGQLMQYVISFVAVAGITTGLGYKNLFIDEAFGVAAASKLPDLGDILKSYIDKGMQIILVSQNDNLYKGIPHRVINLEKDGATGLTSIVSTLDF